MSTTVVGLGLSLAAIVPLGQNLVGQLQTDEKGQRAANAVCQAVSDGRPVPKGSDHSIDRFVSCTLADGSWRLVPVEGWREVVDRFG